MGRSSIRRQIIFAKWDRVTNMTAAEISYVLNNPEYDHVSQTSEQARKSGAGVLAGRDAARELIKMIPMAAKFRGQYLNLPEWNDRQWFVASRAINFISRFRDLSDKMYNKDNSPSDLNVSIRFWGHNVDKFKRHFPKSKEIKHEVRQTLKQEKEKQKNLKESFIDRLLLL